MHTNTCAHTHCHRLTDTLNKFSQYIKNPFDTILNWTPKMSVPTIKCSSQYIPPLPCFSVSLLQQGWYQMSSHFSALLLCLVCRWGSSCLVHVDQHHFVVMLGFAARVVSVVQPFLLPCCFALSAGGAHLVCPCTPSVI